MAFQAAKPNAALFKNLATNPPPWWGRLIADKDIWVDVRRDKLSVYYNCSSLMELTWSKGLVAQVNPKYIPFEREKGPVKYQIDGQGNIQVPALQPLKLDNFSESALKQIKKRVDLFNTSGSEKSIQARFVRENPFIDTELAHKKDGYDIRVDLTWIDVDTRRIVFVELKRATDPRLVMKDSHIEKSENEKTKSISKQIKEYRDFIHDHKRELLQHYKAVFEIKHALKILPKGLLLDNLDDFAIEEYPLLLVADCTNAWIRDNAKSINAKLQKCALGTVYLGNKREGFHLPRAADRGAAWNLFR